MHSSEWGPEFFKDRTERALAGDQAAWTDLCGALKRVAWKVIMSFGLRDDRADDAMDAAMFRLATKLRQVEDPARLPGWFATTTRRECLNVIESRSRVVPSSPTLEAHEPATTDDTSAVDDRDDRLLRVVYEALAELSEACQRLLRLCTAVPALTYAEIADELDMPIGAIGPNRQRCLQRLRARPALARFMASMEGRS